MYRIVLLSIFLASSLLSNAQEINRALNAWAYQSTTAHNGPAALAVDGNTDGAFGGRSVTHTATEAHPWWQCDMGESVATKHITIWNRTDCCSERLQNFYVFGSEQDFAFTSIDDMRANLDLWHVFTAESPMPSVDIAIDQRARYVLVVLDTEGGDPQPLSIAEFQVWADDEGKSMQSIAFPMIPKKRTDDADFSLQASASSGLPITYTIIDGPATISNNVVSLTGAEGTIRILAEQAGDDSFYAAPPAIQVFEVVDPTGVVPQVHLVSATSEMPLYMPIRRPFDLRASASIDHDDLFDIEQVAFAVDGQILQATHDRGLYSAWWKPSRYGNHTITVKALGSNGEIAEEVTTIEVMESADNTVVSTFEEDLISFPNAARTFSDTYYFPSQVGAYHNIVALLSITCPTGGCDPWDRVAWIEARWPGGEWIEIIRYITPFGVACSHAIDVTEYASILQGEVELRMFIDTWAAGWEVSLIFDMSAGDPPYPYSRVDVVWDGVFDFGNMANLQPLDTVDFTFAPRTEKADMHVLISGHGWGVNNTANAAEFRRTDNELIADGMTFEHRVWNDCDPNPDGCQPQGGTWWHTRSGWCPGAITHPFVFDLSTFLPNDEVSLIYRLDPTYRDLCHPNNPDCVSGVTCSDCQAGFNPHYHIGGNLVSYGNEPLSDHFTTSSQDVDIHAHRIGVAPNPVGDVLFIEVPEDLEVLHMALKDPLGRAVLQKSGPDLAKASLEWDVRTLISGTYYLEITTNEGRFGKKVVRI